MVDQNSLKIKRLVAHFPGFEPVSMAAHHERYIRSSTMSSKIFGFKLSTSALDEGAFPPRFAVDASGPNWSTSTEIQFFDHLKLITDLRRLPFLTRLWRGYSAAFRVLLEGGFGRYLKVSWRFALFFLYPFLLMALGVAIAVFAALMPFWTGFSPLILVSSLPLVIAGFIYGFLPLAELLYLQHSMTLWQLAVKIAALDDTGVNQLIENHVAGLQAFFRKDADEYLITTFSLGGAFMVHSFGLLLERNPELIAGKAVSIATLGGPGLQCSLLKSASVMRGRIRTILAQKAVFWLDVQCYSDIVNFYQGRVARDNGLSDMPEPVVKVFKLRHMLFPENYRKIRWDAMRVHRQFVYGSDKRSHYDFTLLTAGPFNASQFARFTPDHLPPLGPDGTLLD
jgi:hypothetical protein